MVHIMNPQRKELVVAEKEMMVMNVVKTGLKRSDL